MSKKPHLARALTAAAALATFAIGSPAAAATAAAPTTPPAASPLSATGCSGNTCMYLAGNSGGTALVQAWARTSSFTGYFHLTGPGVDWNSANQYWRGGKGNYASWAIPNAAHGTYCVSGYSNISGYQGTACEYLS